MFKMPTLHDIKKDLNEVWDPLKKYVVPLACIVGMGAATQLLGGVGLEIELGS
jgi:hypothetical protein